MPLLKTDLFDILTSCVNGQLATVDIKFQKDSYAVGVVLASGGYPEAFKTGYSISGSCEMFFSNAGETLLYK